MKHAGSPVEPWLRGTLSEVPAVPRAVLHALELAQEDLTRWCSELSDEELQTQIGNIPSIGFQLRHIGRSVDRLLSYAEGKQLSPDQLSELQSEAPEAMDRAALFAELSSRLEEGAGRVKTLAYSNLEEARGVGRRSLPTTLGGLLVHVADHTQPHVGQAITTVRVLKMRRSGA